MVTKLIPLISEGFKARNNVDGKVKVEKHDKSESLLIKDIASLKFIPSLTATSYNSAFNKNFLS
jgi:hypothetical protein